MCSTLGWPRFDLLHHRGHVSYFVHILWWLHGCSFGPKNIFLRMAEKKVSSHSEHLQVVITLAECREVKRRLVEQAPPCVSNHEHFNKTLIRISEINCWRVVFVFVLWRLDLVAIRGTMSEDALVYTAYIINWSYELITFKIQDVTYSHIITDYNVHGYT